MSGDEHHIFEGTVKFQAERGGVRRRQLVDGKTCEIQVEVCMSSGGRRKKEEGRGNPIGSN